MSKLILSIDGSVLREYSLDQARTTIGRLPNNDIQLENLAISGKHAVIVSVLGDDFLQDLGSTNGSFVNGNAIKKHRLVDGDLISLGKYRLKYFAAATAATRRAEAQLAMRMDPGSQLAELIPAHEAGGNDLGGGQSVDTVEAMPLGELEILSGRNAGQRLQLTKERSVIGKQVVHAAAIERRGDGYFLFHLDGVSTPLLNGQVVDEHGQPLADQDLIELAGVKMAFRLKG